MDIELRLARAGFALVIIGWVLRLAVGQQGAAIILYAELFGLGLLLFAVVRAGLQVRRTDPGSPEGSAHRTTILGLLVALGAGIAISSLGDRSIWIRIAAAVVVVAGAAALQRRRDRAAAPKSGARRR